MIALSEIKVVNCYNYFVTKCSPTQRRNMQKVLQGIKVYNKTGQELSLKNIIDSNHKVAFVIVFNRNQNTKHFCKVWSAKLDKISNGTLKVYKILAFKTAMDDVFKGSFDNAMKSFCQDDRDENVFAIYGNCAKKVYNASKLKTEDMVSVAVFGEDKSLVFLHSDAYNENAVKSLEKAV